MSCILGVKWWSGCSGLRDHEIYTPKIGPSHPHFMVYVKYI